MTKLYRTTSWLLFVAHGVVQKHDQLRSNSITLSCLRAGSRDGSRAGLRRASELDSVMEFGLSSAIRLASSSRTSCTSWSQTSCDRSTTRFELLPHVEIALTCLRQVGNQVCDQLANQCNGIWPLGVQQRE